MTQLPETTFEVEFADGLRIIAANELRKTLQLHPSDDFIAAGNDYIRFHSYRHIEEMQKLRSVVSIYACLTFSIPRPRALLGHEHFTRLMNTVQAITTATPTQYTTFNISAAGSDSSVMQRIKTTLAEVTGLKNDETGGDLFLRIRRRKPYWDVLIRTTPRPLSTRQWRVCDYEGALNAPVACAMAQMSSPEPQQRVVNLCCGSGSLMIERLAIMPVAYMIGIDYDQQALTCAEHNLRAADNETHIQLIHADASNIPLQTCSADVILADLPFGQRIGSHTENERLYPALLQEAARIASKNAVCVLITHEVKLITASLRQQDKWRIEKEQRVSLRGLTPRIYRLRRS